MTPAPLVQLVELDGLTVFEHEAMATRFTLHLTPSTEGESRVIAEEAFRLLDRLEERLSFYREGSDVTRINRAAEGEILRIDEWTHRCLLVALEVAAASDGAFDPFAGFAAMQAKRQNVPSHLVELPPPAENEATPVVAIDPEQSWVTKLAGRRWLDLGAVGKGVALDAMAELLREWRVPTAVLVGGGSSVLVYGAPAASESGQWTLVMPQLPQRPSMLLTAPFALGASGEGFQPGHIIRGAGRVVRPQALVLAPSAALADALSTAALLLSDGQVRAMLGEAGDIGVLATHVSRPTLRLGALVGMRAADPLVTLVIPCWCESQRLPGFLAALGEAIEEVGLPVEIRVLDDGSPQPEADAMRRVVEAVRQRFPLVQTLASTTSHLGKGGAVYEGWRQSAGSARWLAFVDADGAVPAAEVVRGLQLALNSTGAERFFAATRYHHDPQRRVERGWIRQRTGGWFARWAQRQLDLGAIDSQCGFKIVPATWWRQRCPWREEGYAFDLELLSAARDDALPVTNLSIAWREVGGSHVSWRDGLRLVQQVKRMRRARVSRSAN